MDYTYYRIDDICSIKSGKRLPKGSDFSQEETPYGYIRARDIKKGKINLKELVYIDDDVKSKIKKYIIEEGDIAITIVGENIGDVGYCTSEASGNNLTENAVRLTGFKENVDSKYLCYFLNQSFMKQYMSILGSGAAQGKLGIYKIQRIKVPLPDIETQNKVTQILAMYDELIECNNRQIENCNRLSKEVFNEWFLRFRYPGHEKDERIEGIFGKVPDKFISMKMQDVIDFYIGGGWGNDEQSEDYPVEAYVIRGTDFPYITNGEINTCPLRYHKQSNYDKRQLRENDFVLEVSGGTAEQPVGRTIIVDKETIERFDNRVICASFCKLIRLNKKVTPYYFYHWMQFLYDTRIIDKFQLQSTGIINFKFEYFLRKGDILVPPLELMNQFEEVVKPLQDKKNLLAKQNDNLTRQRDLLTPRLMSGKLKV